MDADVSIDFGCYDWGVLQIGARCIDTAEKVL
jgi:hypothetical protein